MFPTATPLPGTDPNVNAAHDLVNDVLAAQPIQLILFIGVLIALVVLLIAVTYLYARIKAPRESTTTNGLLRDLIGLAKENGDIQRQVAANFAILQQIDAKFTTAVPQLAQLPLRFEALEKSFTTGIDALTRTFQDGLEKIASSVSGIKTELAERIQTVIQHGDTNTTTITQKVVEIMEASEGRTGTLIATNGEKTRNDIKELTGLVREMQEKMANLGEVVGRLEQGAIQPEIIQAINGVLNTQREMLEQVCGKLDRVLAEYAKQQQPAEALPPATDKPAKSEVP